MRMPVFMEWTIIPAEIVARAWTDQRFRRELLLWPNQTLDENGVAFPPHISFCIMENTEDTNYLVFPYRKSFTYGWSREKVATILREETGGDNTLEYWLPVEVMVEAYFSPNFKKRLFLETNAVLQEMGYDTEGRNFVVVENTENTYHLVIPLNKWATLGLNQEELEEFLVHEFTSEILVH